MQIANVLSFWCSVQVKHYLFYKIYLKCKVMCTVQKKVIFFWSKLKTNIFETKFIVTVHFKSFRLSVYNSVR